jgi:putative methyltransferase (TIGR04325 family)
MRVRKLIRRLKRIIKPVTHYDGVYHQYDDSVNSNVYDSPIWLNSWKWYIENDLANCYNSTFYIQNDLTIVTAFCAMIGSINGVIKLLDFGGGIGNTYVPIVNSLEESFLFEYHIVDTPINCQIGETIFKDDTRVTFNDTIPALKFDIIFCSQTLQYIEDWAITLSNLCSLQAQYIVLAKLTTTEIETFGSKQNLIMTSGPHKGAFAGSAFHWFFNRREIRALLEANGYLIMLDLLYSDLSPAENLPEGYRDCTSRILVFRRRI